MLVDLVVEGFAEGDGVPGIVGRGWRAVLLFVEPKMNLVEEVEVRPVEQAATGWLPSVPKKMVEAKIR